MTLPRDPRQSDRWVTPNVVVAGIVMGGLVVLALAAGLVYLAAIGRDPEPVLSMLAQVIAATTGPASLLLQLANRATTAKTERNTGALLQAQAAAPTTPPATEPYGRRTAPARLGSE